MSTLRFCHPAIPRLIQSTYSAPSALGLRFASNSLPHPPPFASIPDPQAAPEETRLIHSWVERFKSVSPASDLREAKGISLSFSRSSGPGGQNVNKVNTKATIRCALDAPWIPMWAKPALVKDPHFASSSNSILVTSTQTRSQAQNIDDCLGKLHKIILEGATAGLVNPTSEETKNRVQELMKLAKTRRKLEKDRRSSIKRDRKSSGNWD